MVILGSYSNFLEKNYNVSKRIKDVDCLFVDLDCIINRYYSILYAQVSEEKKISMIGEFGSEEIYEQKIFEEFISRITKEIRNLISSYRPNMFIYLLMSGVPSNELEIENAKQERFDNDKKCLLTIGTEFYFKILREIEDWTNKTKKIENRKILISSYLENSEVKYKINDYYRSIKDKVGKTIVYSENPEILLMLVSIEEINYLYFGSNNILFDVGFIKRSFQNETKNLYDYIFLIVLCFDKFISKIFTLNENLSLYEEMFKIYLSKGIKIINPDFSINFDNLLILLKNFEKLENEIDRNEYYLKEFGIKNEKLKGLNFEEFFNQRNVDDMVLNYLECMSGITKGYFGTTRNYKYKYYTVPLIKDITQYLQSKKDIIFNFNKVIFTIPEYTLSVIPRRHEHLMFPEIKYFMKRESETYYLFPNSTFKNELGIYHIPKFNFENLHAKIIARFVSDKITVKEKFLEKSKYLSQIRFIFSFNNSILLYYSGSYSKDGKLVEVTFNNLFNSSEDILKLFDNHGLFVSYREILYSQMKSIRELNGVNLTDTQKKLVAIINNSS